MSTDERAILRAGSSVSVRRRIFGPWLEIVLFLAPAFILYVVLVLLPVVQAIYYSGFKWNGLEPLDNFIGLLNYQRALADRVFQGAIGHNGIFVVLSLLIQFPLALGLALLLDHPLRGRGVLRLVFFAPYVLSEVITGVVWSLMLQPDGLADKVFEGVGLGFLVPHWLADRSIVLLTMFLIISWKYLGFGVILLLAGLQGIPRELKEAAWIDGASPWRATRYVTVPLLGPTIRIWAFLAIIGSLQLFDLIWIVTGGGPSNATNTMATYMVDVGFRRYQFGYGSAVAVILFAISLAISLVYQRFVLRRDTEGAVTRFAG